MSKILNLYKRRWWLNHNRAVVVVLIDISNTRRVVWLGVGIGRRWWQNILRYRIENGIQWFKIVASLRRLLLINHNFRWTAQTSFWVVSSNCCCLICCFFRKSSHSTHWRRLHWGDFGSRRRARLKRGRLDSRHVRQRRYTQWWQLFLSFDTYFGTGLFVWVVYHVQIIDVFVGHIRDLMEKILLLNFF